ncbi:MAG: hypothetical protein VYA34_13465 [Myxococcota bacterium]|nr:hypothetical protein [Myxococcota bacterium]
MENHPTKKVAILFPVGAGGPLGIAAVLKESRPTAITAEALLQLTKSQNRLLDGVDAAVLLGTEGNVSHIVDDYLKARLSNVNSITESSTYGAGPLLRRTKSI